MPDGIINHYYENEAKHFSPAPEKHRGGPVPWYQNSPARLALLLYRRCSILSLSSMEYEVTPLAQHERRASRRFLIRLHLVVRWADENVIGEAETESREVSSRGLYFH